MNLPSIKTLDQVLNGKGKEIRNLLERKTKTSDYKSVQSLVRQCYNMPDYAHRLMTALDEITEGCGVEAIFKNGEPVYEYINMGDTYTTTIMRNIRTGRIFVACWGDIVERGNYDCGRIDPFFHLSRVRRLEWLRHGKEYTS